MHLKDFFHLLWRVSRIWRVYLNERSITISLLDSIYLLFFQHGRKECIFFLVGFSEY